MLSDQQIQTISRLVARYDALSPGERHRYQETEVRTNFIDPLFAALGWPMDDRADVERETSVAESKRPDYIFKLNGVPHLFLEAKRFTEDARSLQWAADAISKAYNKGVGWAAVTNFADLVVYDAYELLPAGSRPRTVIDLSYKRYADPGSLLHELSPDDLQERLMEKRAQEAGIRTRAIPIEKRLYQSMRDWREKLINDMARYNIWQTEADYAKADEAVQRLIDRLLFLRHCEDRGITDPDLRSLLHRIQNRGTRNVRVTQPLLRLFARAANTFDSEVFQTDALIDVQFRALADITDFDDTLAEVIKGLYSVPLSLAQYDFSLMDADILGQVYEQYLGHVAQQSRKFAATQAALPGMPGPAITVEAKRQRRRERGIYYTPAWVVRYIVDQTVGRFLRENHDRPDAIASLTILDPACGSGSFLIRAYETLLDYYAQQMGGDIPDTTTRHRILTDHIYGVDLDPQAVEIARLNLLLRMVRREERLPELKDNIRVGNSLIGGGEKELRPYFGAAWESKRPFTWESEFPRIMERGGFDIIIGNPPYVRIQTLPRDEADYYRSTYHSAFGSFDIYVLFLERAVQLLREGGRLGFITGGKFLKSDYGKKLCDLLLSRVTVEEVLDVSSLQVFSGATTYPVILIFQKGRQKKRILAVKIPAAEFQPTVDTLSQTREQRGYEVDQHALIDRIWPPPHGDAKHLLDKIQAEGVPLESLAPHIFQGVVTSADHVYTVSYKREGCGGKTFVYSRATGREHEIETGILKTLVGGKAVDRYQVRPGIALLVFPYDVSQEPGRLLSDQELQSRFPLAREYLEINRDALESREDGKMRHDHWYGYVYPKNLTLHAQRKLIAPRLVYHLEVAYDPAGQYYLDNVDVGGIILRDASEQNYLFTLALLNGNLADFFFRQRSVPFRGEYRSANRQFLAPIPIKLTQSAREAEFRDQIVSLAGRMLDLHQRLAAKGDVHDYEREQIEREIAATDREIDNLVYDLYGLTAKERAVVEAEVQRR